MHHSRSVLLGAMASLVLMGQAPPAPIPVPLHPPAPVLVPVQPPAYMPAPPQKPLTPLVPVVVPATSLNPEELDEAVKGCEGGHGVIPQYQLQQCSRLLLAPSGVSNNQTQRALLMRARAYFDLGHLENAESDLTTLLKRDAKNAAALTDRARAKFYLKSYKSAISDATAALGAQPQNATAYYHRANSQYELREYTKALADYDAAIKIDPKYAHAYADRGITQLRRENFQAAIADIQTAIRLEGHPIPWAQSQLEEAQAALAALQTRQSRSLTPLSAAPSLSSPRSKHEDEELRDQIKTNSESPSAGVAVTGAPLLKTRIALVIGNSAYQSIPKLANASNDATDVAKSLQASGYKVFGYPKLNLTRSEMFAAIKAFQEAAPLADTAVVWYAGHGQEFDVGGAKLSNWLIPVDFPPDGDVIENGVPLSRLMTAVSPAKTLRVVIVDACRNNNIPTGSRGSRGFSVEERSDMLIVYSTRAGRLADDGPKGARNSPFAAAFLETMGKYGRLDVRQFFGGVSQGTVARTRNLQPPQEPEKIDRIQTIATLALAP